MAPRVVRVILALALALAAGSASAWKSGDGEAKDEAVGSAGAVRGRTFVFYYLWYGTPATDGHWMHWDHEVLPHWTPEESARHPTIGTRHSPPDNIHAPFYPARGLYSSGNETLLAEHFAELRGLGEGVVAVLSWWGQETKPGTADTQGVHTDSRVPAALRAAEAAGIRICWHLEPYPGRSPQSVREDVAYLTQRYGASPALLDPPVYFVYDSYHNPAAEWAAVLRARDRPPGVFIGLWLERPHGRDLAAGGFDGFYTYFAATNFVYGSSPRNWPSMVAEVPAANPAGHPVRSPCLFHRDCTQREGKKSPA